MLRALKGKGLLAGMVGVFRHYYAHRKNVRMTSLLAWLLGPVASTLSQCLSPRGRENKLGHSIGSDGAKSDVAISVPGVGH